MTSRPQKDAAASRQLILEETAKLLLVKGYTSTSLRDIAEAAGMKAGSLYYHFQGKEDLVEAVIGEGVRSVEARVLQALEKHKDAAPLERVRHAMIAHMQALNEKGQYASAHIRCVAHLPTGLGDRMKVLRKGYDLIWEELLTEAQQRGALKPTIDIRNLKFTLFGLMNWTLEWNSAESETPKSLAEQFWETIFKGAANPEAIATSETAERAQTD